MNKLFFVLAIIGLIGASLFTVGCPKNEDGSSEYNLVGSWKVSSLDGVLVPSDFIYTITFAGTSVTGSVLTRYVSCTFSGNYSVADNSVNFNFIAPFPEECDVEAGTYTFSGTFTTANEISGIMRNMEDSGKVKSSQSMILLKISQ